MLRKVSVNVITSTNKYFCMQLHVNKEITRSRESIHYMIIST